MFDLFLLRFFNCRIGTLSLFILSLLLIILLLLWRFLPIDFDSILFAVDNPANAHLAQVEVVVFTIRVLPALYADVMVKFDLATLASIREADNSIALPFIIV